MASDRIPSIDLSDFISDQKTVVKGIKEHIQQLPSCNEIGEVKLLGLRTIDGLPTIVGDAIVATFQALLPEPGQERTIQRVELNGNIGIFNDQGLPGNRGNLTVECLYLHYDGIILFAL